MTLVFSGQTFSIDEDDLSVVNEEPETESDAPPPEPKNPPPAPLCKRDSSISMISSCSVESDWSDDEIDELEKIFGNIQQKSSEAAAEANLIMAAVVGSPGAAGSAGAGSESAFSLASAGGSSTKSWKKLKKSRRLAMAKLQQQLAMDESATTPSPTSTTTTTSTIPMFMPDDDRVPRRFSQNAPYN